MTRVLLCYAHADDETLWGHPWLIDRTIDRRVLICCSDARNPERQSYRRGEEALSAVCADVGITEYRVLSGYFSEFYKLRTRGPGDWRTLKVWWDDAQTVLREMMQGCDFIVTHSPIFEYGHMDHCMVRRMVSEMPNRPPLRWTDARVETLTWPVGEFPKNIGVEYGAASTSPKMFNALKDHYVSRECWTWSSAEPLNVALYKES